MVYLFLSAVGSVSVALLFVASLYVWKSSREAKTRADRDNPEGTMPFVIASNLVSCGEALSLWHRCVRPLCSYVPLLWHLD